MAVPYTAPHKDTIAGKVASYTDLDLTIYSGESSTTEYGVANLPTVEYKP